VVAQTGGHHGPCHDIEPAIRIVLTEIQSKLNEAARIAKPPRPARLAGSVAEGVPVSMDIEQLIYEAGADGQHTQTIMTFTRRLSNVETIRQQDSAERALNKLARTL
jgi:hypothetical protein